MADVETQPVLPRIVRLLAPYKWRLALVAFAVVVSALLTAISPFLVEAVFDRALFPSDGGEPDLTLLWWLTAGLVAIPLVSSLINMGQTYLTTGVGNEAMADLRIELFQHLQRMELAFFTATKTGAIQSRLANDVAGVRNVLTSTATTILSNVVTVVASFIAMVVLSWQLTAITLILMPLFVYVQIRVGRRRQRLARKTQESLSEMTAITEESLSVSGILLAKVFNRADAEIERYREANRRQTRLQMKQTMTGRWFFAIVGTFFAMTPAVIYLVAGYLVSGGGVGLTAGTIVAFTTLQARLQGPLMQMMRVTLDVQTSLALFRRLFEYLDLEPAISDRPDARSLETGTMRGRIELRDVWFRYPKPRALAGEGGAARASTGSDRRAMSDGWADIWALRGISLVVEPGQLAAIVGPSGSGKTTLTYLVPRLHDVTRGTCLIDDVDVRDLTMGSIADGIGMVTQEPYLFHATIADNLRYARPNASDDEVEAAARDANIHDRIMSFEHGYETVTGERGYRLSGGEKQRLAIARVLLKDPRILILDEATSALDTATERLVQEALERAMERRTTIAIAHRLSTIMSADVIFGLADGRLVEQGTHEELLAHGGLYARLYAEQFGAGTVEARLGDCIEFADGTRVPQHTGPPRSDVPV